MSAFGEAISIFTAQGVPVIPTRIDAPAMPMVKHPDRFGVPASLRLVDNPRFAMANAAIWTGRRSGVTVIDVDSADPQHEAEAVSVFGETPLKIGTPSGGMHLYYRHAGEQRRIRPFGKSLPLDILGNGLAAVPPSLRTATGKKTAGGYRVLEGDLTALRALPSIKAGAIPQRANPAVEPCRDSRIEMGALREGDGRDNALFEHARRLALYFDDIADLRLAVRAENAKMAEPLPGAVADAKAAQAWRYKVEGRLMVTGSRAAVMDLRAITACTGNPAAFLMLAYLRSHHGLDHVFAVVPEAICGPLGMSHNTARGARDFLLAADLLEIVSIGDKTRDGRKPNLYRLKPSSKNWGE